MTFDELARRIATKAVLYGEFTLRSGRKSNYYLDKYLFVTDPKILHALGELFMAHIPPETTRLAGAELGGIPLVTCASLKSGLPSVFVRNEKKGYGTAKMLEGELQAGDKVVLLEDICTSGGQVLEAARILEDAGAEVVKIVGTIDREEGAKERIITAGYPFAALFTKSDLGLDAGE